MSLRNFSSKVVKSLRGAWTRQDRLTMRADRGYQAQNVRFTPGRVMMRDGYANRLAVASKTTSLYSWIATSINWLIYVEGTAVKYLDMLLTLGGTLWTANSSAVGLVVAEGASRLFQATFNNQLLSDDQGRVINAGIGGYPADKLFMGPMQVTSVVFSEPSAGLVTAGTHYFGFIVQSRTGFQTKPSPVNGSGVFVPVQFVAAGLKKARLFVTANTPPDGSLAYPIMTRADNPNRWFFVPDGDGGTPSALPPSTAGFTFFFDLNITDEDLAARATEVIDNFDYLTQSLAGSGPFNPNFVKAYGKRMTYISNNDLYISDPDAHQQITAALHKLRMPGERKLVAALVIRGVYYPLGPSWTYSVSDRSGSPPKEWSPPQSVSEGLGTRAPLGVTDKTAGDYGWVAAEPGLYLFNGSYAAKPISYNNDDWWQRINRAYFYKVVTVDDYLNQRVLVACPVDAATELSHILVWDYSRGFDAEAVDFSYDLFDPALFPAGFAGMGLIYDTDKKQALWVSPSAIGQIVKQTPTLTNDQGLAVDAFYETGHLLAEGEGAELNRFSGVHLDVRGEGRLEVLVYTKDRKRSMNFGPFDLTPEPDEEAYSKGDLNLSENFSMKIGTALPDHWFDLSRVKVYWRGMGTNR